MALGFYGSSVLGSLVFSVLSGFRMQGFIVWGFKGIVFCPKHRNLLQGLVCEASDTARFTHALPPMRMLSLVQLTQSQATCKSLGFRVQGLRFRV